ncbi:uncharacterized protein [Clytia hemisphaerica]|uniref:uncharacterized protein n=1 Tax=Clytia hemisphaerica TaxID=252671 RepID=UPI0034D6AF92
MASNSTNSALQTSNLLNGIFTSILSVFGTIFNAYIIQHFYKKLSSSQKRKNINTLMLGQSIVDFYNSAFAGPSNAVYYFGSYRYGNDYEKTLYFKLIDIISPSLYVTSLQISMLCFLLTAFDRLLSITFPVFHHVASTPKKLKICMVLMWIGSALFSCIGEVYCHVWKNFYNNPTFTVQYHVWILVLDTILVVLIAILWISTMFTSCSAIKKSFERKITMRPSVNETEVERQKRKLQEKHLMQMFGLMFFIFAVAFIPSLIFWFMDNKGLYQENPEVIIAWHCSSTTFALSSVCNPLFMLYYAPDFKRSFKSFKKQLQRTLTGETTTASEIVSENTDENRNNTSGKYIVNGETTASEMVSENKYTDGNRNNTGGKYIGNGETTASEIVSENTDENRNNTGGKYIVNGETTASEMVSENKYTDENRNNTGGKYIVNGETTASEMVSENKYTDENRNNTGGKTIENGVMRALEMICDDKSTVEHSNGERSYDRKNGRKEEIISQVVCCHKCGAELSNGNGESRKTTSDENRAKDANAKIRETTDSDVTFTNKYKVDELSDKDKTNNRITEIQGAIASEAYGNKYTIELSDENGTNENCIKDNSGNKETDSEVVWGNNYTIKLSDENNRANENCIMDNDTWC